MKNIKKIFSLLVSLLLVCLFGIVGCATTEPSGDELPDEPSGEFELPVEETVKPFPENHGKFYTKTQADYYVHWVHTSGQKNLYGELYVPKDFDSEKEYPTIIMSHGFTGSYNFYLAYIYKLVSAGYVCYAYDFSGGSPDKCLSDGDFYEMSALTEVDDLQHVVADFVLTQDIVKTKEIYLMGESMGGLVTALAAPNLAKYIAGVILFYPALDLPEVMRESYPNGNIPDDPQFIGTTTGKKFVEDIYELDVFAEVAKYEGEVLIFHGDADTIVDHSVGEKAANTYKNAELVTIEDGKHGFANYLASQICNNIIERLSNGHLLEE